MDSPKSKRVYRVAVIGCRGRGTAAARAYHAHPRTELVGLCDLVKEARDQLGDEIEIANRFEDMDQMIRQTAPDIVVISTATDLHYELSMRTLEHGINIEVEKPICTDLYQADQMITKAQEIGIRIAVHHQGRVGSAMRAIHNTFTAGKIGGLRYIHCDNKGYYGGYGLMNIGTHKINDMLKLAGRCQSVVAQATTRGDSVTPHDVHQSPGGMGPIAGQYITAMLQFEQNVTGTLLHHQFSPINLEGSVMEWYGTEGRLFRHIDRVWFCPQPHYTPALTSDGWELLSLVYPQTADPQVSADDYWFVDEYVQALDQERDHECSGLAGRHALEVMMGIFSSIVNGKRMSLPQCNREHPLRRWRQDSGLADLPDMPRSYVEWLKAEGQTSSDVL